MRYTRKILFILLALGLIPSTLICHRLLDHANWATKANSVEWVDKDGHKIEKLNYCSNDYNMNAVVLENTLWTFCRPHASYLNSPDIKFNPGFARIDPAKGVGTLWQIPKTLPVKAIQGVAVGPDRQIAFVYEIAGGSELAIATFHEDLGWMMRPKRLPHSEHPYPPSSLKAVSWISGELTLFYFGGSIPNNKKLFYSKQPFWITKIKGQKIDARRYEHIENFNRHHRYFDKLMIFFKDQQWHVAVGDTHKNIHIIKEDGSVGTAENIDRDLFLKSSEIELAATGLLDFAVHDRTRYNSSKQQMIDGKILSLPTPPVSSWEPRYTSSWFKGTPKGLIQHPRWTVDPNDSGRGLAQPIGDKWLLLKHHSGDEYAQLLNNRGAEIISRPIADGYSSSLTLAVPIPNGNNGFWLVNPHSGSYVTVDNGLRRLDQRSVFDHLLDQKPELSGWWNRSKPFLLLIWALAGLPLSLAFGYLFARIRGRDIQLFLCWGAAFYFLFGGLAMEKVLPMLR